MDSTKAGMGPSEMMATLEKRKAQRALEAQQRREMCLAVAHVFGHEGERTEAQRKVWSWLTAEMWSKWDEPTATSLPIFEGRRQKAVEAVVMLNEAKGPPV